MPEPARTEQMADCAISEIPASCTCTWTWGKPEFRWVRIGPKETCPWHRLADAVEAAAREGWKL